jgi:hypothetical protein
MSENIALIRFVNDWVEDGVSEDGLPRYREAVKIIKAVPPLTELPPTLATEDDFEEFAGPYQMFLKEQKAIKQSPTDGGGFPLALWPAITKAELKMLSARDITTIEQLARLADRADPSMPGEIRELAARARQMATLSKEIGQFEEIISRKDGELEVLREQLREMRATIASRDALILALKQVQIMPGDTPHHD